MARGMKASWGTRVAGSVPLLVAFVSAAALTGAAFFTVEQAACSDPGNYVRHDNHIELVGGCVDRADLPATRPADRQKPAPQIDGEAGFYRP
ncbi:MAG: hypothetical protein GEU86_22640 [Actinophytocola sp.]|nr:hypothetical protein [Actinophytocola sp.]